MDNENFDNIFETLTPVTTNSRYAKQKSDLLFNPEKGKNGKFEVSDSLFRRLQLNDNGFILFVGQGQAYIAVVPNEDAVAYAGRPDTENKTDEFTSTEMRDGLNDAGLEGNEFWLEKTATKDNVDYYRVLEEEPTKEEEVESPTNEETEEEAPVSI